MWWVIFFLVILFALLLIGRRRVEKIAGPSRDEILLRMFEDGTISKEELRERTRRLGQKAE